MSLNADALNFSNLAINDTIQLNNKVYTAHTLEEVGASVANTSTVQSLFTPVTNNINDLTKYMSDDLKIFAPYYISNEVKTDYFHFANDLSYVTVPPYTTCMIQQNLIFSYGINYNIPDPSAQIHNIYINFGCSKTVLTSPPYINTGIDTVNTFSNTNIIPFSFNQKLLVYTRCSKVTPINSSFFYDNTTDISQNIYLFASMQQYYNASPTKIVGKLVYNFIKNNTGTQLFTYNPFSTTYKSLLTTMIRSSYGTYNSNNLGSITIPANNTVIVHNAVSIKLQQMLMYNFYGTLRNMNYYFYSSTSSTPYYNLAALDPNNYSQFYFGNPEVVNQSMKSVQLIKNKENEVRYLFDTNTFIYSNTTSSDITLYLHFGITYDTRNTEFIWDIKATGTTGSYTLTNNTSNTNIIKNTNSWAGSISSMSYFGIQSITSGKKYLSHIWTHHGAGDSSATTKHIMTNLTYNYNNPGNYATFFYPEINSYGLEYITRSPDFFIPNQLNSTLYAGDSSTNYGATISTLGIINTNDIKSLYTGFPTNVAGMCITNIGVNTEYSFILVQLD